MKYQSWKIKSEHHILPDFKEFLKKIEEIEEIKRIIPARISRQQKWSGWYRITFSYFTESGMKYNLKKWATAQELFVICKKEFREKVKEKIGEFIISNIK